jgi:hypothetical protein
MTSTRLKLAGSPLNVPASRPKRRKVTPSLDRNLLIDRTAGEDATTPFRVAGVASESRGDSTERFPRAENVHRQLNRCRPNSAVHSKAKAIAVIRAMRIASMLPSLIPVPLQARRERKRKLRHFTRDEQQHAAHCLFVRQGILPAFDCLCAPQPLMKSE